MHDAIYRQPASSQHSSAERACTSLKLSAMELRDALASGRYAKKIQADFIGGVRSGVNGTPTFFINGVRHDHPLGVAALGDAIDEILRSVAV